MIGGDVVGKQSVVLTWAKEMDTCERQVFFFHKSGNMFELTQQAPKHSSSNSISLANIPKFECKCELEVGEHEGSLNIGDAGVYEISPFTVKKQTKPVTVVLKTFYARANSNHGILTVFIFTNRMLIHLI